MGTTKNDSMTMEAVMLHIIGKPYNDEPAAMAAGRSTPAKRGKCSYGFDEPFP